MEVSQVGSHFNLERSGSADKISADQFINTIEHNVCIIKLYTDKNIVKEIYQVIPEHLKAI